MSACEHVRIKQQHVHTECGGQREHSTPATLQTHGTLLSLCVVSDTVHYFREMQLFKYLFIWFNIDVFAALCVLIPTAGSGVEHLSIYISTQSVCGEKCEND